MKSIFSFLILMITSVLAYSQNTIRVVVRSDETKEPLARASVVILPLNRGTSTDTSGIAVIENIPDGNFELQVSFVGYHSWKKKISLPDKNSIFEIELDQASAEDNPDVVVTATRTDRSIRNTPTRVEVIAGGEITENVSMKPGEIRMLLNETTGLITQQTSPINSTATLRIQELDGRYTQLLRDGFPLYSGLSQGLSLVQIAPLDLKQVEIIKGSSSTLYGGGAIAGLINLVSKTPTSKRDLSFLANGTSAGGLDLSGFYGERYGKTGLTLFASQNGGAPFDPSNIGLTAIPKFHRFTLTPRFFLYGKKTNATAGISFIHENRLGGSMNYVKHGTPGYYEENKSDRFTTQFGMTTKVNDHLAFNLKNSYNHFRRSVSLPSYQFEGLQQSSFSEVSINAGENEMQWIAGMNFYTDNFNEVPHTATPHRDYHNNTVGLFVQNTWSPSGLFSMETGLRGDYTDPYGFILLPRLSALFNFSKSVSSRIGAGFGYRIPTIFTEESEEQHFKNILPVNNQSTRYEQSVGLNADFSYRTTIDELKLSVNPLFFYTRINHPLVLQPATGGQQQFSNASGFVDSKGLDLSIRLTLAAVKFFTGYSYTIVESHFNGATVQYPLAPRHKLHLDLVYEIEGRLRIALESYYTSKQQLSDGSSGRNYWLLGALIEKSWKRFSIFMNIEDLNDARQAKWEPIYTGSIDNPQFRDVYAPLDGRIINGGIKIKL